MSLSPKPHFILAYSGCDASIGEAALAGASPNGLVASNNPYDWLGTGVYFWEDDPVRAMEWAREAVERHKKRYLEKGVEPRVRTPFVVGAVISLGRCLDLTTREGVGILTRAYRGWRADMEETYPDAKLPVNEGTDFKGRYLDCRVINYACAEYAKQHPGQPIQTVRGVFLEGDPAYDGASFAERTHTQIAVREPSTSIIGFFRATVS